MQFAAAELAVNRIAFGYGRLSGNDRSVQHTRELFELVDVLAYDEDFIVRKTIDDFPYDPILYRIFACDSMLRTRVCDGVSDFLVGIQIETHFDALRRGDPAGLFELFPRNVVTLRPDEAEHIAFAAVFPHERRRQPHAAHRLQFRNDAENGSGQHVHFVVEYQPPRSFSKQRKVRIRSVFFRPPRQYLIRRDSHRLNRFFCARVFGDIVRSEIRFVDEFRDPLMDGRDIRRNDERTRFEHIHDLHADDRFAGTARKHDRAESRAGAFVPDECFRCFKLVFADDKRRAVRRRFLQADVERFSVCKRHFVFYRPARLYQFLLYRAAVGEADTKATAAVFID